MQECSVTLCLSFRRVTDWTSTITAKHRVMRTTGRNAAQWPRDFGLLTPKILLKFELDSPDAGGVYYGWLSRPNHIWLRAIQLDPRPLMHRSVFPNSYAQKADSQNTGFRLWTWRYQMMLFLVTWCDPWLNLNVFHFLHFARLSQHSQLGREWFYWRKDLLIRCPCWR